MTYFHAISIQFLLKQWIPHSTEPRKRIWLTSRHTWTQPSFNQSHQLKNTLSLFFLPVNLSIEENTMGIPPHAINKNSDSWNAWSFQKLRSSDEWQYWRLGTHKLAVDTVSSCCVDCNHTLPHQGNQINRKGKVWTITGTTEVAWTKLFFDFRSNLAIVLSEIVFNF